MNSVEPSPGYLAIEQVVEMVTDEQLVVKDYEVLYLIRLIERMKVVRTANNTPAVSGQQQFQQASRQAPQPSSSAMSAGVSRGPPPPPAARAAPRFTPAAPVEEHDPGCQAILKTGDRAGKHCGHPIKTDRGFCLRHKAYDM